MHAYYFDNEPTDQRLPHETNPLKPVDLEVLKKAGVLYWNIPVDDAYEQRINQVALERGYKNRDTINVTRAGLGDAYDAKIKMFFEEHLHEDEEIRYVLSGTGYFDVREMPTDNWIRIAVSQGDLIVLPAGIYHRFTLDMNDDLKAMRLFKDEPKWAALNRSNTTDENEHRVEYMRTVGTTA